MIKRLQLLALAILFSNILTAQNTSEEYVLVFSDEFNQNDGSQPDADKWVRSKRQSSTWSRWISDSKEVAYIENGCLVLRAIPNNDKDSDPVDMLTGAVETQDKFSFKYGKVEIRMQVEPYKGSFPAAWMMPQPPADGWPIGGEIDIFESIDAQNTAYHTVHTNWTYNLGNRNSPQSSFSEYINISQWHIYGFEWTEDYLRWTVDGRVVGTYRKSIDNYALDNGQWPFDHEFYIILNQSVGNGSWAANAVTDHTYTLRVDYVRVYQKQPSAINELKDIDTQKRHSIFTIDGQKIASTITEKGIYIVDGKKLVIK